MAKRKPSTYFTGDKINMGQTRVFNGKRYTDDGGIHKTKAKAKKRAKRERAKGNNARVVPEVSKTITRVSRKPDKFKTTSRRTNYVVFVRKK